MNNGRGPSSQEAHLEPPGSDSQSGGGDRAAESGEGRAGLGAAWLAARWAFSFQVVEVGETFQSECDQLCLLHVWQFIKMD